MILHHPALPEFEPILNRFFELAMRYGFAEMEKRRYRFEEFNNDPTVRKVFIRACHYGYDLAQRQIADLVISMEEEIGRLSGTLKEQRRQKVPAARATLGLIQITRNRQIVLRRLIDSILFAMVKEENWLFRRFTVDMSIHNIDPAVLARTVRTAVELNRDNRLKFNLVSDLSTVVQIGDLVEIDATAKGTGKWRIVELKEGKVNELIAGLIEREKVAGEAVEAAKEALGEKGAKQAGRVVRQVRRMKELRRIVETDRGVDPLYETETLMSRDSVTLADYHNELERVYEHAKKKGSAAIQINECLRIFGISQEKLNSRQHGAAAHQFFHMASRGRDCALLSNNADERNDEMRMVASVPYFVDITSYNLNVPMADPIFSLVNSKMVFDLVMRRVRIFVQFDVEAFFRFAEAHKVKIRWISGKEAQLVKRFSKPWPGTDAWGILAELANGDRMTLLPGFLIRPFTNFTTPHQLLEMILNWPEQLADTDPSGTLGSPI
jgi:hypothetical protein